MARMVLVLLRLLIAVQSASLGSPWPPSAYARADAMLLRMNLTEKVTMAHGWPGSYGGSVVGNARLGIPPLHLEDGPQGVGDGLTAVTAFPSSMTVACSWDTKLAFQFGQAMGQEQYLKGTNVMLGPGVNLARAPWNGRLYEYLGEDPFLASSLLGSIVTGIQTNNITATVKHFMGNNQEHDRGGMSANIPQRAAMELYYASYQGAIDAGVGAVMLGTNAVNGTKESILKHACAFNAQLTASGYNNSEIIGHLKSVMGFQGWVMTDWDGPSGVDNANAGLDQGMPGTGGPGGCPFWDPLVQAVQAGRVPVARLDDMVRRMLVPMYALGLMDDPPTPARTTSANARSAAHDALARHLSEQATVLLRNEGALLPLDLATLSSILVVGDRDMVVNPPPNSGCVQTPYVVSPFTGVAKMVAEYFNTTHRPANCTLYPDVDFFQDGAPCVTVVDVPACCAQCTATPGCLAWSFAPSATCPGQPMPQPAGQCFLKQGMDGYRPHAGITSGTCHLPVAVTYDDGADLAALQLKAAAADVVVVVVAVDSHEGYDRTNLSLPDGANNAVLAAVAANPRTVVVTRCPGPCLMPWGDAVPAILAQSIAGQEAGNALASILFGIVNPSGKLPLSFPASETDTWLGNPVNARQYPGIMADNWLQAEYSEGLLIGYRWYDAQHTAPLWPFGHGLSYTSFAYSNVSVSGSVSSTVNTTISITVTNTGPVAGAEVVQLYIAFPAAADEPPQLLKGFAKLVLAPQQSLVAAFPIGAKDLRVWSTTLGAWTLVAGPYFARVGSSSRDIRAIAEFAVTA